MRRLILVLAALSLIGLAVWAFMPRPIAVELAEVDPRTIEVDDCPGVFTTSCPVAP